MPSTRGRNVSVKKAMRKRLLPFVFSWSSPAPRHSRRNLREVYAVAITPRAFEQGGNGFIGQQMRLQAKFEQPGVLRQIEVLFFLHTRIRHVNDVRVKPH